MRKIYFIFVLLASFALQNIAFAAPETYTLDNQHTYVLWHIKHFGFSSQSGKWYASGKLVLDKENPANSKVEATIDVSDMITGIPALDKHLKGKVFFDTAQYPKATFVSDKVEMGANNTAKVHGSLTVRGVTKPLVMHVTLNKDGINPISEKQTAGFSATADLSRSDFGIKTLVPGLGDKVRLNIEAEAVQQKSE